MMSPLGSPMRSIFPNRDRNCITMEPIPRIDDVAGDDALDQAYDWLCHRRREAPADSDVWLLRRRWTEIKPRLRADLGAGRFRFGPLERLRYDGDVLDRWSALDALVLKAIAIVLQQRLTPEISPRCHHLPGNGGAKGAVRAVADQLRRGWFVFRSDARGYFAGIVHEILYQQLRRRIDDPRLLDLLWRYLRRTLYDGGYFKDVCQGIPRGCPLAPFLGAVYLAPLDEAMAAAGVVYSRFMDDWVILAPTRWKLRRAVRVVNEVLAELGLEKARDKTFVGRVERGFDFLGYRFGPDGVRVAEATVGRFAERVSRLYERGADGVRIGEYARRWGAWVRAGLGFEVGLGAAAAMVARLVVLGFCAGGGLAVCLGGILGGGRRIPDAEQSGLDEEAGAACAGSDRGGGAAEDQSVDGRTNGSPGAGAPCAGSDRGRGAA